MCLILSDVNLKKIRIIMLAQPCQLPVAKSRLLHLLESVQSVVVFLCKTGREQFKRLFLNFRGSEIQILIL